MVYGARWAWLVVGALGISLLAGPASANTATLKCNASRDQIWMYDSLTSFNVDAKLKCGEGVEILERVPGFVKIRAQAGVEGYVPEDSISDLPGFEPYRESSNTVGLVAKEVQAKEIARATANAAALAPEDVNYSELSSSARSDVPAAPTNAAAKETNQPAVAPIAPQVSFGEMNATPATAPPTAAPAPAPHATATIEPEAHAALASPPDAARSTVSSAVDSPDREKSNSSPISAASAVAVDSRSAPDATPPSESRENGCRSYFSAYGLTPSQTKWIAQNREKEFAGVCPAPDPSKVDFVIILTHDVDFFSATMPSLVHKSDGFSDFTPMTSVDSALVPVSQADKARREYVWIFQFEPGTFDPAGFSPQRQYQFSKMETSSLGSKAGIKAVEDAFRYVAATSR